MESAVPWGLPLAQTFSQKASTVSAHLCMLMPSLLKSSSRQMLHTHPRPAVHCQCASEMSNFSVTVVWYIMPKRKRSQTTILLFGGWKEAREEAWGGRLGVKEVGSRRYLCLFVNKMQQHKAMYLHLLPSQRQQQSCCTPC